MEENLNFEKKTMKLVRNIVGLEFKRSSKRQDYKEATDLIDRFGIRLGVRVRRYEDKKGKVMFLVCRKGKDLTFRDKTEIYKLEKLVKLFKYFYYFYGFSNEEETSILNWVIIDLKRALLEGGLIFLRSRENEDGKTTLLVYEISNFCIVKNWEREKHCIRRALNKGK